MIRKLITTVVVVALLGSGWWYVRTHAQVSIGMLEGRTVESHRGDLMVPITASGRIEPLSVVQIKGKASGEVVEALYDDGAMVEKGQVVVRLDPEDEQRNVDRANAEYERARITLERAKLAAKEKEEVAVPAAEARLIQSHARLELAKFDYDRMVNLRGRSVADPSMDYLSPREYNDAKARFEMEQAGVRAAEAELNQAKIAINFAQLEIEIAEEALKTAEKALDEARQRLEETTVVSPIDGMILRRHVQAGEVVQSGRTSLTGGTVLMEIADVQELFAVVHVDEADIGMVRQLAPPSARPGPAMVQDVTLAAGAVDQDGVVEINVESFRDERFYGEIVRIAPQSQLVQAIATFRVWIRIASENRNELIGLLNTQAEANFMVRSVQDAVLVSYDAIKRDPNGEGYGVYVQVTDPETNELKPEFRLCTFGMDNGIDVEVIEGLEPGVVVYTQLPLRPRDS